MDRKNPRKTAESVDAEANLRAHIESYMHERALNQEAMAKRLHIDPTYLGRIRREERGVSIRVLLAMRELLHQSADLLMDEAPKLSTLARVPPGPRSGR